jgi:hypothetical protein
MSGAAGGSRIKKEDLKATIRDYRDNILKPLGLDKSYSITGVRSRPEKDIFGDIDIVVSFPGGEKKELKQDLAKFLSQVDAIPTIPHKKNNKYFIHGNIVSTLYPIFGKEDEYVQIDNIVTTSKEEGNFTFNMLDLPAQEQTLAIGLAKTIFTELDEKQIENLFKELNVPTNERPGEGEEYDFNLNPSELTLRIVPIGGNDGRTIWKSSKFDDVKKLTSALGINIETDKFDDIVSKIKNFKNRRSIDRLKGMFAKNIRVGPAEKELEKGIKKQQAIDTVAALEEKYSPLVMSLIKPFIEGETIILEEEQSKTIALMPGAFKPPHRDHLRRINAAAENSDKAIILISPLDRVKEGETPISAKQSLAIWQLYKDKEVLAPNVEFLVSLDNAPVKTAYDISTANPQNQYIGVYGKDDAVRWKNLPNEKYPNLRASDFGIIADLSASGLRAALKNNEDITPWMPDGITPEEYKQALGLNQVQELFEPSSNIYDYNQNGLDYYFTTQDGDNYVVGITPESDTRIAIDFGISDEEGDIGFQETNKGEVYKIIATVVDIVKNYLNQHPEIEVISWSSVAKTGEKKIGDTQRDKLYKLVVKRQGDLKDEDIVRKDSEYWAYLKGYNPMFEDISNSELFDIEDYADEKLDPIDIKIPDHFVDRVNDKRNKPSIKPEELYDFFDKLADDKEDLITLLNKGEEVVATDSQSKINIPLTKDRYSQLKSKVKTVAKTIMRKDNFQTTSPKLVFEKIIGDNIICDSCDWSWKIEDGGSDLYICHKCGHDNTPKETNKFFDPIQDKQIDLNISSEPSRVDYYKDHIQNVVPSDFKVEKNKDKIVVSNIKPKTGLENNLEFKELLVSLTMYMMDQINIEPLPDLVFIEDDTQNAKDLLGKTAHYNSENKSITLYTHGRHPKDILRSYAHEMIHHKQNLEGKLTNINTQNINEDEYLKELEAEAYTYGNGLLFRGWENSIK